MHEETLMIIDVIVTLGIPGHFSEDFPASKTRGRAGMEVDLTGTVTKTIAHGSRRDEDNRLGGKAKLSGTWVDDAYVANMSPLIPDTLIGFFPLIRHRAGIARWKIGHQELGLRGINCCPMYAGFSPGPMRVWIRFGVTLQTSPAGAAAPERHLLRKPRWNPTLPRHLDPVAIRYPDVKSSWRILAISTRAKHVTFASIPNFSRTSVRCITGPFQTLSQPDVDAGNMASGTNCCSAPIIVHPLSNATIEGLRKTGTR